MREKNNELLLDAFDGDGSNDINNKMKDINFLILLVEEMLIETKEMKSYIDRLDKRLISIEGKNNKKIISNILSVLFSEVIKYVLLKLDLR